MMKRIRTHLESKRVSAQMQAMYAWRPGTGGPR
jgi:hypothetical protein